MFEEQLAEEVEFDRPSDDDAYLRDSGPLGSRTSVSVNGRFLGEYGTASEAEEALVGWINKNKFIPNVWYVSDHGNVWQYTLSRRTSRKIKI